MAGRRAARRQLAVRRTDHPQRRLRFALTPTLRAGASYGTSFVAPSFNQLYFPGFGTPTLQPEEGGTAS